MKLQPTKFQYSTEKINFAGIVISKKGVEPDPDRMSGLAKYPRPTSTKDVKAFLGCATSLFSFSSVLLQDCKHMRALTTKGAAFHWGEEGEMRRIIQSLNNKQVVVRNDHLPFVQAFNSYQPGLTKAKKNLSGTCGAQHQASPGPQPPLWCTWTPCPITRSTLQSPWAQIR